MSSCSASDFDAEDSPRRPLRRYVEPPAQRGPARPLTDRASVTALLGARRGIFPAPLTWPFLEQTTGFGSATLILTMCALHRYKPLKMAFAILRAGFAVCAGSCSPKSVGKMLARVPPEDRSMCQPMTHRCSQYRTCGLPPAGRGSHPWSRGPAHRGFGPNGGGGASLHSGQHRRSRARARLWDHRRALGPWHRRTPSDRPHRPGLRIVRPRRNRHPQ